MKIQINSLEALERLIGGDTDVEMQVRNSVVQAFTNKHLKSIANIYIENGLDTSIRKYVDTEMFTYQGGWNSGYRLSDTYKPVIKQMIDEQIRAIIREDIQKQIGEGELDSLVKGYINQAVSLKVNEITKTLIEEEAKKQIKAKFG